MNTHLALSVLERLDQLIESARPHAQARDLIRYWERDKTFISNARTKLLSDERESIRWVVDQMRNVSQGFGGYCNDHQELDSLLDEFYSAVAQLLLSRE